MYEITRACKRGDLQKCVCHDKKQINQHTKINTKRNEVDESVQKAHEWTGCSDNVIFGYKLSKRFVDSDEKLVKSFRAHNKQNSLMNIHNNEVGRRIILKNMKEVCKCHGVSGSCSIKVCWKVMPDFRQVGNEIMTRYSKASRIEGKEPTERIQELRDIVLSRFSRNANANMKSNKHKDDLIFIERSPNFCRKMSNDGLVGTSKRMCSHSDQLAGVNSTRSQLLVLHEKCEHLCCGRGFHSRVVEVEEDCECEFQWCCSVKCKKCQKKVVQYFCN